MAVKKPVNTKVIKPKAPAKPKFGEVGYEFNVKAKIVEVNPEDDEYNYPFVVEIDMGNYENQNSAEGTSEQVSYSSKKDFIEFCSKHIPSLLKSQKQEELNKAKAEVARLTKELAEIK